MSSDETTAKWWGDDPRTGWYSTRPLPRTSSIYAAIDKIGNHCAIRHIRFDLKSGILYAYLDLRPGYKLEDVIADLEEIIDRATGNKS